MPLYDMRLSEHIRWRFSPTTLISLDLVSLIVSFISLRFSIHHAWHPFHQYCFCKAGKRTNHQRTRAKMYSQSPNQLSSLAIADRSVIEQMADMARIALATRLLLKETVGVSWLHLPQEKRIPSTTGTATMDIPSDKRSSSNLNHH